MHVMCVDSWPWVSTWSSLVAAASSQNFCIFQFHPEATKEKGDQNTVGDREYEHGKGTILWWNNFQTFLFNICTYNQLSLLRQIFCYIFSEISEESHNAHAAR